MFSKFTEWWNQKDHFFQESEEGGDESSFGEKDNLEKRHAFFKQLCDIPQLMDLLPYGSFDEKTGLFINQESVGFVLETNPLIAGEETSQTQIQNFLNTVLPLESSLQVCLYADPTLDPQLEVYEKSRSKAQEIFKKLVKFRCQKVREMAYESSLSPYTVRNFRVIWSFSIKKEEVSLLDIVSIKDQLKATLNLVGLNPIAWKPLDLIHFLDLILHPVLGKTKPRELDYNPYQSLNGQGSHLQMDTHIEGDEILCRHHDGEKDQKNKDMAIRTFSVKGQPNEWQLGMMPEFLGSELNDRLHIGSPFLLHYGFHIPKQNGMKAKIASKESLVSKQAHSPLSKFLPHLKRESAELAYVMGRLSSGDRIVKTQMSMTIFCEKEKLDQVSNAVKNIFLLQQWRLMENTHFHLPQLLSTLPMSWDEKMVESLEHHHLLKTTLTSEVSNNLPCVAEWKGVSTPCFMLFGRKGQVFTWSPFDSQTNYNTIVVGTSGSGKSVMMQELMMSFLGMNARVIVFDLGRSFEKSCKLTHGQYIRFDTTSTMCINPFSYVQEMDGDEQREQLEGIVITLEQMAERREGLDDLQSSFLQKAVHQAFAHFKRKTTISDVAQVLFDHADPRAQDVGSLLFNYTSEGAYGKWFNGEANINLQNDLVVIELEDLKEKPALQNVVLQSFLANLTQQLYLGDRKKKTIFVIDEAAQLLENPHFSKAAQDMARRVRKYEACLITGTQSFADFYANDYSTKILDNAAWVLMLNQEPTSIEQLAKTGKMSMTSHKERVMKSVRTVSGQYSEILISSSMGYTVGRLILDPFSLMLYSTKAEDFSLIQDVMERNHCSVEEAIEKTLIIKEKRKNER